MTLHMYARAASPNFEQIVWRSLVAGCRRSTLFDKYRINFLFMTWASHGYPTGSPMGCPWSAHGVLMGYPWANSGQSAGSARAVRGQPIGSPRAARRTARGPREYHEQLVDSPWAVRGQPIPWAHHGQPMGSPRAAGRRPPHGQPIHGHPMASSRTAHGIPWAVRGLSVGC